MDTIVKPRLWIGVTTKSLKWLGWNFTVQQYMGNIVNRQVIVPRSKGMGFNIE